MAILASGPDQVRRIVAPVFGTLGRASHAVVAAQVSAAVLMSCAIQAAERALAFAEADQLLLPFDDGLPGATRGPAAA